MQFNLQTQFDKLLMTTLIGITAQIPQDTPENQVLRTEALRNFADAIASMQDAGLCGIDEDSIEELINRLKLNTMLD